ncbi:putative linocin/CFP29 family protein [Pseudoxanthomonas sp. 3HH-4]|uniref:family 1 encapsulin nanocompartment shell protein n=1 Tax=Pseudoxanthomonas sp. 3HH-4 TaxID=1690214 RepID=UPI00115283FD|nr:family 1 encapsulin nanocompartment shell protein [Pseudoxanthomonas sp. 3HH-4]TQM12307.1 putative linocin/CFP29 family protein [Pseudoxanthomonas sp. 3HH-4]
MNNLHRQLAPISSGAWEQIEEEASRTLKRYLAARKVVDVIGPAGSDLAAVGTGHLQALKSEQEGLTVSQYKVKPLVRFRVPFKLSREAIDSVERGANDPDLQPLKDAARCIAFGEDRAIVDGYALANIDGIRPSSSNQSIALPAEVREYPGTVERAVATLKNAGVNGPYKLLLGRKPYERLSGAPAESYPVLKDIRGLIDGEIIWAPAIEGGLMLTGRGGDFELHLGEELSIGYIGHSHEDVELYFQESFTFLNLTTEASVDLSLGG